MQRTHCCYLHRTGQLGRFTLGLRKLSLFVGSRRPRGGRYPWKKGPFVCHARPNNQSETSQPARPSIVETSTEARPCATAPLPPPAYIGCSPQAVSSSSAARAVQRFTRRIHAAQGMSMQEIADELDLKKRTVQQYIERARKKVEQRVS